jgi:hypothetical protein
MLTEKTLQDIAKRAGLNPDDLIAKVKSESEETIDFDGDGEYISSEDLEAIKERAGKDSYKEGKKAGEEMSVKAAKEKYGLDFEGKTVEILAESLKKKVLSDAKIEPTKKIQELESDNEKLRNLVTETETKLTEKESEYQNRINAISIETAIKGQLPETLPNGLTREDAYILYKSKRKFQKSENDINLLNPETGEILKDKKLNPIDWKNDISQFVSSFGVNGNGRGGTDNTPKPRNNIESLITRSEVDEYVEKENIPLSDRAGVLAKAMKNEGFKINE